MRVEATRLEVRLWNSITSVTFYQSEQSHRVSPDSWSGETDLPLNGKRCKIWWQCFSIYGRYLYTNMWIHLYNKFLKVNLLSQMQTCTCEMLPSHLKRGYSNFESHQQHMRVPDKLSPDLTTQCVIRFLSLLIWQVKMTSFHSFNLHCAYYKWNGAYFIYLRANCIFFSWNWLFICLLFFHLVCRLGSPTFSALQNL